MPTSQKNNDDENRKDISKQMSKAIHDLNNTIGPVFGYAEMIKNDIYKNNECSDNPKLIKRIEKICTCAEKAGEVIERLNNLKYELEKDNNNSQT